MLCVTFSLSCKLALMGTHEEDSVLLQTLGRRVALYQVSSTAVYRTCNVVC